VAALAACARPEALPAPDIVARIEEREIRYGSFADYLQSNLGEVGGALESEALSALFDQFVDEQLLVRLALDLDIVSSRVDPTSAVEALLASEGTQLLADTAIAGYYAEHAAEFRAPEKVELRSIRTDDRATIDQARRELRGGADFPEVARRLSSDSTAELGGAQGELAREELPQAYAQTIFGLAPGEVSRVIADESGFRLFQVVRRIPERALELEEVRSEIVRRLAGPRADGVFARFVAEARSRYAVEVYDRNLPFVYRGAFPIERPYEKQ
jgi:parvulin-like peptidyl-prolyl isomerase